MISIETDIKIRELIYSGLNDCEIGRMTATSRMTSCRIRSSMKSYNKLDSEQRNELQKLFNLGLPLGTIEIKTKIPISNIIAFRRYLHLCKREEKK